MEEGKGQGGLATSHQYGNTLLGVCYQEEEVFRQIDRMLIAIPAGVTRLSR